MPYRKLTPRQVRWARRWMTLVIIGLFIFILGAEPDLIGMDRSPVVGFVQIGVWLSGLALLLVSAYAAVRVIRNSRPTSLRADIGVRLIGTGYVVAAAASLADFIGIGAQHMPTVSFGPLQVVGLIVGVLLSLVGLILYFPRIVRTPDEKRERKPLRVRLAFWRRRKARLPEGMNEVQASEPKDE
jgi:hypothetical protein